MGGEDGVGGEDGGGGEGGEDSVLSIILGLSLKQTEK